LALHQKLAAGRLLLISPFGEKVHRLTADTALIRNRFVAALADTVLVARAQPGSKTESLAREAVQWGKRVYTLDYPANEHLLAWGVSRYLLSGVGH
jgi:predicted Rossmann fold nucleotide-binding protein DprA/Smf involved in DNA uptake